ncbi:hypothetical protein [Streptomyces sp. SID12501]|uniref:Uncharacterized protein n=1 Tax=Streptomyces sp. SID12501 TaxID=2706042 RepID=A0A6B3BVG7_9ACTN|nr:hypothetical protein [Streptomyces sp. SID12501]NEC88374.1 hypothetical protein [Streptomyces sp. SID12501]
MSRSGSPCFGTPENCEVEMSRRIKRAFGVTVLSVIFTLPVISAAQATEADSASTGQEVSVQDTAQAAPDNWAWD